MPEKGSRVPEGASLLVALRRGPEGGGSPRVGISVNPPKLDSPASTVFPIVSDEILACLPLDSGLELGSVRISLEGKSGSFSVESMAFGPFFLGIDKGSAGPLRVSSRFTQARDGKGQNIRLDRPFAGLPEEDAGAGVLLDYGGAKPGEPILIVATKPDGTRLVYSLRTRPRGTRTCLDRELLGSDIESLELEAPADLDIKAFYAADISREDNERADLGRVLLDPPPRGDFALYRWDMLPSVLVLDFKDYDTQDKYLKRLAFFVEKTGFRGSLVRDADLTGRHGWNAHDYGSEDLAAFYRAAAKKYFPLHQEERDLESLLARYGVIQGSGGDAVPGNGAIISIARESSPALRWTFIVHESTHAVFFSDPAYRRYAQALWASLGLRERWFWTTYFGWAGYDPMDDYLMGNEFQAYLLQQPVAAAEEYFTKRKSAELLEKHPELTDRVAAYMAEFGTSFAKRAAALESWMEATYGIEAGRTVFLTRRL
jgi:hypothetical protein